MSESSRYETLYVELQSAVRSRHGIWNFLPSYYSKSLKRLAPHTASLYIKERNGVRESSRGI